MFNRAAREKGKLARTVKTKARGLIMPGILVAAALASWSSTKARISDESITSRERRAQ